MDRSWSFTQPLIGNYGIPSAARDEYGLLKYFESPNIQACGIVVADVSVAVLALDGGGEFGGVVCEGGRPSDLGR